MKIFNLKICTGTLIILVLTLSSFNNQTSLKIWSFDCKRIVRNRTVKEDELTHEKLISIINASYVDKVVLAFVKISHDTIYVKIKDSEYLTERMGTCGADDYLISATFSLTELKNISYANFDFEIGDHASPGTYSRKYYWDWIEENKRLNNK